MTMKKILRKYDGSAEFIVGDHYVNISQLHAKADSATPGHATQVGSRYIVTAGTLVTKTVGGETIPVGFCFRDVDVTDGDAMLAITVHAVVKESALPGTVSAAEKAALNGITFV